MLTPIIEMDRLNAEGTPFILEHVLTGPSGGEHLMHCDVIDYADTGWIKLKLFRTRDALGKWKQAPEDTTAYWYRMDALVPFAILKEGEF